MPYKDPDNQRRKAREYYYQHREEVLRKRAAYREQNRERLAAAERERFRNRDVEEWNAKRRVYDETYREKKREDPEWVERQQAHRQRQQERGKAHIAEMLSSGCLFCGAPGEVFHHFYPLNKENTIAGMGNRSLEVIDAEAANCWVVCECCHSNIHRRLLDPLPIAYEYNALNQGSYGQLRNRHNPLARPALGVLPYKGTKQRNRFMRYLSPETPSTIEQLSQECWSAVERAQDARQVYEQFANPVRMAGGSWRACATNQAMTALYG